MQPSPEKSTHSKHFAFDAADGAMFLLAIVIVFATFTSLQLDTNLAPQTAGFFWILLAAPLIYIRRRIFPSPVRYAKSAISILGILSTFLIIISFGIAALSIFPAYSQLNEPTDFSAQASSHFSKMTVLEYSLSNETHAKKKLRKQKAVSERKAAEDQYAKELELRSKQQTITTLKTSILLLTLAILLLAIGEWLGRYGLKKQARNKSS